MTWRALGRKAELREKAGLRRRVNPRDSTAIDLAGNDYLGLSRHPAIIAAATAALAEYGLGATGSRLVRGTTPEHVAIEDELAAWIGTGSAVVYSSGYMANVGAIRAVVRRGTRIVIDAHAHASLIDGARATGADIVIAPHNDVTFIAGHLRPGDLAIAESIYSVDGDAAPLATLHAACHDIGALLLVDDAHGLGVTGPRGAGGAHTIAGEPEVIITATLSKALGAAGGVVAGPSALRRHLIDTGRTFIYDTAPPPAVIAGARAAIAVAQDLDTGRRELRSRAAMVASHFGIPESAGGVLSLPAFSPQAATTWAGDCQREGVAVGCFRPPSTPDGTSRLRLTISLGVSRPDFDRAVEVVSACAPLS
ncbi:MAG: 8-amino-7-oxononanoate synthase [Longispora sp.]|nr:8-amino-7-oxononanoate synthase [Longispora sp. (in: high G+C Gram-positive bacteria)]